MRYSIVALVALSVLAVPACDKAPPVAPAGTTITLSANPNLIAPDGEANLTAIVRRDNGSAVNPGTEVLFSTTLGEIDPTVARTDNRGVATSVLRGNGQVGTATVEASSGAAAPVSLEIQVGSLATSITLQATPGGLPREGGVVELLALVRDGGGQLLADVAVNFETEIGTLDSRGGAVITNQRGEAFDRLTVTANEIAGLADTFFLVSALTAAEDGTLLEASTEIGIVGAVAFISLQATPASVPEEGGTVSLLALVRDDVGDPVEGAGVNFLTAVGTLSSAGALVRSNGDGEARDTLTVTAADLDSVSGQSFQVRAQTVATDGSLLEAVIAVGVQSDAPRANFTFTIQGLTATFTNTSTGMEPLTFQWDFGDPGSGANNSSTLRNPQHTFTGAGTYQVTLIATNAVGSDTATKPVTVP